MIGQALGGTPLGFEPQGGSSTSLTAASISASGSTGSLSSGVAKTPTGVFATGTSGNAGRSIVGSPSGVVASGAAGGFSATIQHVSPSIAAQGGAGSLNNWPAVSSWNPADVDAGITLSSGNTIATTNSTAETGVRSVVSNSTGKYYVEFTAQSVITPNFGLGIANSSWSFTDVNGIGGDTNSVGIAPANGDVYCNNAIIGTAAASTSLGTVISMAVDLSANLIWFRINSGNWNNSGTANPASGTGGFTMTGLTTGPFFTAFGDLFTTGDSVLRTGSGSFVETVPSGFNAWDGTLVSATGSVTGTAANGLAGAVSVIDKTSSITGAYVNGSAGNISVATKISILGTTAVVSTGNLQKSIFSALTGVNATGQVRQPATSNVIAAATSNIHVGLSSWVTGTAYNFGDRTSRSGNAYQCITAGTSSGAPSGTGSNITDGTAHWKWLSAIDFTDVQSWANSIPSTLTQPYLGLMWNDGAINISDATQSYATFNNHTTSSTNTITLSCAPGESIRDSLASGTLAFAFNSSKGVSFILPNVSNAGQNYFNIYDSNVILDGLQIVDPNSTSGSTIIQGQLGTNITISNCIIDGAAQTGGAVMIGAHTIQISNSLIIDRQATSDTWFTIVNDSAASFAVNCTFVSINNNTGGGAFVTNGAASYARNCIFSGYTNSVGGSGNLASADHCVLTAANVGSNGVDGGNNRFNRSAANQFISPTTDFRTKYSSDGLDAGSTDTSDIPTSTDIAGTTRPQGQAWDIGAWEFVPLVSGMGIAASAQPGSLSNETIAKSVTGVVAAGSAGTVSTVKNVSASITLTGVAAQGSSGSIANIVISLPAVGVACTGQIGSPSVQVPGSASVSGQNATASVGILNPTTSPATLSAVFASASVGSFKTTDATANTGQTASGLAGSLVGPQETITVSIAGVAGAGQNGTSVAQVSALPSGVAAAGSVSSVATQIIGTVYEPITGVSASGNRGTLTTSPQGIITGVSGSGTRGVIATTSVVAANISNIHFGLAAWAASTSYASGNRVSSNGNAYQAITSGTSAGTGTGPSGTGSSITDNGVTWKYLSAIDFTNVQSWANAIPSTLTLPLIGFVWNDGAITTTTGTPFLSLFGHTTTTANTITLQCAAGESFRDVIANRSTAFAYNVNNGVSFVLPSGTGGINYFDITDANVIIDGFQFQDPNSTSGSTILQVESGSSGTAIQNCIFDGYAQTGGAYMLGLADQATLRDCLVVDHQSSSGNGIAISASAGNNSIIINNTIVCVNSNTNSGVAAALVCNSSSGIAINRNNYFLGYTTPMGGNGDAIVPTDHCVFSATSSSYSGSCILDNGNNQFGKSIANQFISTTDFRTKYSSDGLSNATTDITDLPSLQDISYANRPAGKWDVGAWQLLPFSATSSAASGQAGTLNNFTASGNTGTGGLAASASAGSVSPSDGGNVSSGSVATGQATSPTTALTTQNRVAGRNATGQTGQFFNLTENVGFSGQNATASAGSFMPTVSTAALQGGEADANVGSASGVGGGFGNTLGIQSSGQNGSLAVSTNIALSGLIATAQRAPLAATDQNIITGAAASGLIAALTDSTAFSIVGMFGTGQANSPSALVNASITGQTAQGFAGFAIITPTLPGIGCTGVAAPVSSQSNVTSSTASGAGQAGSFTVSINAQTSGVIGSGSAGSARGQTQQAALSGNQAQANSGSVAPDPSAIIIGQTALGSAGTVGVQSSSQGKVTLVGVVGSAQLGSIISMVSSRLSGVAATTSNGSVSEPISYAILGQVATALLGSLIPTITLAMVGLSSSASVASITAAPSDQPAGLSATALLGAINWTVALAFIGQSGSANNGALQPGARLQTIAGVAGSGQSSATAQTVAQTLFLGAATGFAGSFLGQGDPSVVILGRTAVASVASLATTILRPIGGLTANANVGSGFSTLSQMLMGQLAAALVGSLAGKLIFVGTAGTAATGLPGSLAQVRNVPVFGIAGAATNGSVALSLAPSIIGLVATTDPIFRRASVATYVDSSGVLQIANANTLRYDHGVAAPFPLLGALLETASTNLMTHSDMIGWTARGTTTTNYGYSAPDRHGSALFVTSGSGSGIYDISRTFGGTAGTQYTQSVYAKAMGYNYLHMQTWDFGTGATGGIEAWFDLGNGAVVSSQGSGTASGVSASITLGPDGFYRCALTGIASTNPTLSLQSVLRLSINGSDNSIVADGVSGILVYGDQVEAASVASSYIPTTSTTQTRLADVLAPNLGGSTESAFFSGAEGDAASGFLRPAASGIVLGIASQGQISSPSIAEPFVENSIASSGQSGTLSPYEQITGIFGASAASGAVSFPTPQPAGILAGRNASGQTGNFAFSATDTISSIFATSNTGILLDQVAPPAASISASGAIGTLKLIEQVSPPVGIVTQGLSGNLIVQDTNIIFSALALGTSGTVQPWLTAQIAGTSASGLASSPVSARVALISGVIGSGISANSIALITPGLGSAVASAQVGTTGKSEIVQPVGVAAASSTGSLSLALLATMLGVISAGQAGLTSTQVTKAMLGAAAAGQPGQVAEAPTTNLVGQQASGFNGTFTFQEAVFPSAGLTSAAGQAGSIMPDPTAVLSGAAALGLSGVLPRVQSFALLQGVAGSGLAGTAFDQIVYTIAGASAIASPGVIVARPEGVTVGISASGGRGLFTIVETLPGTMIGKQAQGQATSPVARLATFPMAGISAAGFVGLYKPDNIRLNLNLLGVSGTGTAGMSFGWLIIIDVVTALGLPTATVLINSSDMTDDIPENVDVFQVPQVITLLYPVYGCTIGVYSIPQLVNTVIDEYVEM